MTEQTSNSPPPIPTESTKQKSKWRGLTIAAAIVLGAVFAFKIASSSSSSVDLELTLTHSSRTIVDVINVGSKPIRITNVTINDRADCLVYRRSLKSENFVPTELQVGDQLSLFSPCRIVRATVETNNGARTYTFGN